MKKSLLLLFVLLLSLNNSLFSQTCQWAQSIAGNDKDVANRIVADKAGNVYISGYFESDSLIMGDKVLQNPNKERIVFLAKYSSAGDCIWVNEYFAKKKWEIARMCINNSGDLLITAYFYGDTLKLSDKVILINKDLSVNFSNDCFIAKFTTAGECIWAKTISGELSDYLSSIVTNTNNEIIVSGRFNSDTIKFNNGVFLKKYTGVSNLYQYDSFLAKYDSTGKCLWAKKVWGSESDEIESLVIDRSDNILVSGSFNSDTLWFNNHTILTNSGDDDAFIAKFNNYGDCLSASKIAGELEESSSFLTSDAQNNIYIFGNFESSNLTFSNDIALQGSGEQNCYLAKYDSLGVCKWAKSISGSMDDYSTSININKDGIIVISGLTFSLTLNFGYDTTVTNNGEANGFFAKYNSMGKCLGAHILSCPTMTGIMSSTVNENNDIFILGVNDGPVAFNNYKTLNNIGGADSFIAKYSLVTSVADFNNNDSNRLQIAPNPANNYITISFSSELSEFSNLSVYNTIGENVASCARTISNSAIQLDVSNLAAGSYRVVLNTVNGIYSQTFAVVR